MKKLSILKLGDHNSNKRVWIANRNILKAGFQVGDRIHVSYKKGKSIEITPSNTGVMTVSGRDERSPIIDIKNATVFETLGGPEKVEVVFHENRIVISVAKSEKKLVERQEKTGMRLFELFAGGGTLHHFFKQAGYQSAGGLEMSDKYLAVFDANNPEKDIVTICSSIEDVDPSDYPDDVDLVVAGIPCTTFSQGNLKMAEELKKLQNGEGADPNTVAKRYEAEALVFHVLNAIQSMNPRQVVIEEVPQFADVPASMLLRTVLSQWGYHLSETVAYAKHTNRKRWCLVGDMKCEVNLKDLSGDSSQTIGDFLNGSIEDRDWVRIEESKRFSKANATVGLRAHQPSDTKTNTFTTHGTRSTEPCLKHPRHDLYSEFSNQEIARIHGLKGFSLSGVKTLDRQILGQGVADMFSEVAKRVAENVLPSICDSKQVENPFVGQMALFA